MELWQRVVNGSAAALLGSFSYAFDGCCFGFVRVGIDTLGIHIAR